MSSLTQEYIENIITQVAANLKLKSWRHYVTAFECIGQNYFGIIIPLTITGSKDDCDKHALVLKAAPTDERYRVSGAVTLMFSREVFVYTMLLKKYDECQRQFKMNPPFVIPTLYFTRDVYCKEVIVIKDMRESGYHPYTHKLFLDLEHVTIALKSLAQLHSLSFIMKEKHSELYDEVTKVCIPLTENTNKRYMDIMRDRLEKALNKFAGTQYVSILKKLKLNCGQLFTNATELAAGSCICHGDAWKENILFKYSIDKKGRKPIEACLIDYQTTRVSSPAFDVLYLIISSTNSYLRRDNYYTLLDIYYDTLKYNLDAYHNSLSNESQVPECIEHYSRENFDYDLRVVAPACFITANTAMWLANGLQEEGHVRSKYICTTFKEKIVAVNNYKSIVKGIIDDFYTYRYLPGEFMQ